MGILSTFRSWFGAGRSIVPAGSGRSRLAIRSPWSTTQLQAAVLADIFNTDAGPVSRAEAMSVPSVAKARHLTCTLLPAYPLVAYKGQPADAEPAPLDEQPAWLNSTAGSVHPTTRLTWSLDDAFFGGWTLWLLDRDDDADSSGLVGPGGEPLGTILSAERCPPEDWTFGYDEDGTPVVKVHDVVPALGEVLLFQAPFEGMCEAAHRTLRGAVMVENAWVARVRNPIPAVELHVTDPDTELDDAETAELLDDWHVARNDPDGATVVTPHKVEMRVHGEVDPALYVEARNAIRLDVANFANVPASLLEGSLSTASLTYSTGESKRAEFIDYAVPMWRAAFEARLSMDDVTPRGTYIAFDLTNWTETPQDGVAPTRED